MKNPTALPSAKRISSTLLLVISTLVILSLFGQIIKHVYGHTILKGFVPACCLDYESNVPAWYSSLALGIAVVLLLLIAIVKWQRNNSYRWHWAALSALLFLLSADEIAIFHEYRIGPLRDAY